MGVLVTDVTRGRLGNAERLAFVFDRQRVRPSGLACELVVAAEGAGIPEATLQLLDPSQAVRCGLEMVEQVEQAGLPPARVGIASGPVVFQDGDCYGRVVNLAARVMDRARPRQVLTTPEVVTVTPREHARFQNIGPVKLKGIASAIELLVASFPG